MSGNKRRTAPRQARRRSQREAARREAKAEARRRAQRPAPGTTSRPVHVLPNPFREWRTFGGDRPLQVVEPDNLPYLEYRGMEREWGGLDEPALWRRKMPGF